MKHNGLKRFCRYVLAFCLIVSACLLLPIVVACSDTSSLIGQTEITKWQYGKKGAVSITYDDGTINQFRKAIPIMNRLGLPGTFFINTGLIPGSQYVGKFIGRPVNQIIAESKTIPTNPDNVYERASAARYLGFRGTDDYFTNAGARMDAGRPEEAYKIIDELYQKVRNGELLPVMSENRRSESNDELTWEMVKKHVAEGHEFASHMVTHPRVCILDEPNILYELEKSREELLNRLGLKYTISAECPYGTENERAMEHAYQVYPILRNRIPEDYLLELNRSSRRSPVDTTFEYVQWQRGILTRTTPAEMNEWVDITVSQDNMWLVLVIHGVDNIGWEPLTSETIDAYFTYIKSKENDVWVATFGDAGRYMKQRMSATINATLQDGKIIVSLTHPLDPQLFDLPLTLKTYVNPRWKEVRVQQGQSEKKYPVQQQDDDAFVLYQALPGKNEIILTGNK